MSTVMRKSCAFAIGLIAVWMAASGARADIYRYYDENGVMHLTDTPPDSRYKIYIATKKEPSALRATLESVRYKRIPERLRILYHEHILAAAKTFSLEPELLHAVISAESAYNPFARSSKGARGLMQLMPETAKRYGVRNSFDPAQNIVGGAAYLKDLLLMFGNDMQLAVAAYNAGEGKVMKHGRRVPPYRETMLYVPKVMSYYRRYKGIV
ncbi:MAG: DUF4124 domain-containing protein [Betaproteobacteria bacterium]|nr:DUF4124 domain-containing protein [Betaproteobacteria bacterium]